MKTTQKNAVATMLPNLPKSFVKYLFFMIYIKFYWLHLKSNLQKFFLTNIETEISGPWICQIRNS